MTPEARLEHRHGAGTFQGAQARLESARIEAEWSDSIDCERDPRLSACVHGALVLLAGAIAWGEVMAVRMICG